MKIIFLDIDGVLCTLRSHFAYGHGLLMEAWDITCCQMIRNLCVKCDCKIVISSIAWGRDPKLPLYLCAYGLIDHLFVSPFSESKEWKTVGLPGKIRGYEVQAWLEDHTGVTTYVIIDDDTDFLEEQKPFLVVPNSDDGFSAQNYMKCEEILKKGSAEK